MARVISIPYQKVCERWESGRKNHLRSPCWPQRLKRRLQMSSDTRLPLRPKRFFDRTLTFGSTKGRNGSTGPALQRASFARIFVASGPSWMRNGAQSCASNFARSVMSSVRLAMPTYWFNTSRHSPQVCLLTTALRSIWCWAPCAMCARRRIVVCSWQCVRTLTSYYSIASSTRRIIRSSRPKRIVTHTTSSPKWCHIRGVSSRKQSGTSATTRPTISFIKFESR